MRRIECGFVLQMGIPNAARILGQTGVLGADDGGRRGIGRCGHGLLGKAGMDGEQCHYQQHQSAAQQADIHITFPIVHSETPLFHFALPGGHVSAAAGRLMFSYPPLRTPSICPQQNNEMQKSPERYRSRLLCLYVHIIMFRADVVKRGEESSGLIETAFILFTVPFRERSVFFAQQKIGNVHTFDPLVVAACKYVCPQNVFGIIIADGQQALIFTVLRLL